MINLPQSTEFNKKIPKQQFYDNLDVSKTVKKVFVEQIKAIYWQNKFSKDTVNIAEGEKVKEIEFFKIELNTEKLDETIIKLIDKGIPYNIIFVFEFNGNQQMCAALKEIDSKGECKINSKYYYTGWTDKLSVEVVGLSLDTVYENFIRQIAGNHIAYKTDNLNDDISKTESKIKLEKEIVRLEKLARSEKQPRKKLELAEQVKKLKKQLSEV